MFVYIYFVKYLYSLINYLTQFSKANVILCDRYFQLAIMHTWLADEANVKHLRDYSYRNENYQYYLQYTTTEI